MAETAASEVTVSEAAGETGPLMWSPPGFGETAGKAYDLCDDAAAVAAGLDGGALEEDRKAMGIDCNGSGSPVRFGYMTEEGVLVLGPTASQAQEAAQAVDDDEGGQEGAPPSGLTLGYWGPPASTGLSAEAVTLVDGSVTAESGVVRGLVQNRSGVLWARSLTVTLSGSAWVFPLTVQPGETAPFEIIGWEGSSLPTSDDLRIEASLTSEIDLNRSIMVTGAPGYWHGDGADFPGLDGILPAVPEGVFSYFQTGLEIQQPDSHREVAAIAREHPIRNVRAYVAFVDSDGAVLDVVELEVRRYQGAGETAPSTQLAFGETQSVGFVVPHGASGFAIWVGGSQ